MYEVKIQERYDPNKLIYERVKTTYPMPDGSDTYLRLESCGTSQYYVVIDKTKELEEQEIYSSTSKQEVIEFLNVKVIELEEVVDSLFDCMETLKL